MFAARITGHQQAAGSAAGSSSSAAAAVAATVSSSSSSSAASKNHEDSKDNISVIHPPGGLPISASMHVAPSPNPVSASPAVQQSPASLGGKEEFLVLQQKYFECLQKAQNLEKQAENKEDLKPLWDELGKIAYAICQICKFSSDAKQELVLEWAVRAANHGCVEAKSIVIAQREYDNGELYRRGLNGRSIDHKSAFQWYSRSAAKGFAAAQFVVGICYEDGEGVSRNAEAAFSWYENAARQNHSRAQHYVGLCYEKGIGVFVDEIKAAQWHERAAVNGEAKAQYSVGVCYRDGRGVVRDLERAVQWFTKAAQQKLAKAQGALEKAQQELEATRRQALDQAQLKLCKSYYPSEKQMSSHHKAVKDLMQRYPAALGYPQALAISAAPEIKAWLFLFGSRHPRLLPEVSNLIFTYICFLPNDSDFKMVRSKTKTAYFYDVLPVEEFYREDFEEKRVALMATLQGYAEGKQYGFFSFPHADRANSLRQACQGLSFNQVGAKELAKILGFQILQFDDSEEVPLQTEAAGKSQSKHLWLLKDKRKDKFYDICVKFLPFFKTVAERLDELSLSSVPLPSFSSSSSSASASAPAAESNPPRPPAFRPGGSSSSGSY